MNILPPTPSEEFFDHADQDELDALIAQHMGRPTLVQGLRKKVHEAREQSRELGTFDFVEELREYWWLYLFLGVSAIFTGTLGIFMGLDPHRDAARSVIVYNTDFLHLFLAAVYFVAFITVTEVAVVIFKRLYFTREEYNTVQKTVSVIGMGVSFFSVMATGIAGGLVIASTISFMTEHVTVPEQAQTWVIVAIPLLIVSYAFLGTVYALSSSRAAAERLAAEQVRERTLDHLTRIKAIQQIGRERLQYRVIQQYQAAVLSGRLSLKDAEDAISAGKPLALLERERNEDLDGNGMIGSSDVPSPQEDYSPTRPPRTG